MGPRRGGTDWCAAEGIEGLNPGTDCCSGPVFALKGRAAEDCETPHSLCYPQTIYPDIPRIVGGLHGWRDVAGEAAGIGLIEMVKTLGKTLCFCLSALTTVPYMIGMWLCMRYHAGGRKPSLGWSAGPIRRMFGRHRPASYGRSLPMIGLGVITASHSTFLGPLGVGLALGLGYVLCAQVTSGKFGNIVRVVLGRLTSGDGRTLPLLQARYPQAGITSPVNLPLSAWPQPGFIRSAGSTGGRCCFWIIGR